MTTFCSLKLFVNIWHLNLSISAFIQFSRTAEQLRRFTLEGVNIWETVKLFAGFLQYNGEKMEEA